ncbi:MAG: hypothetical protein QW318_06350 [Candidatus Caldarchaeum sp.]
MSPETAKKLFDAVRSPVEVKITKDWTVKEGQPYFRKAPIGYGAFHEFCLLARQEASYEAALARFNKKRQQVKPCRPPRFHGEWLKFTVSR